ncbi:MAG: hypothetical protein IPM92_13600 [Saprospiraceae bacterium]|nr:hypothetical protein [Saprospiraceae bacterium]
MVDIASISNIQASLWHINRNTAFIIGTEAIARRNNNAVFFPKIQKTTRGYYRVEFELLWDGEESIPEHQITERYARALEQAIVSYPGIWLWTHRRWKHSHKAPK